jgi:hypothetical protein
MMRRDLRDLVNPVCGSRAYQSSNNMSFPHAHGVSGGPRRTNNSQQTSLLRQPNQSRRLGAPPDYSFRLPY